MGWISVEDRLPEYKDGDDDDQVLAAWNNNPNTKPRCVIVNWNFIPFSKGSMSGYTHWQPLPSPPEA